MIIKITPAYVNQICMSVRETFMEEHHKVNNSVPEVPSQLGEYFYGLPMPIDDQQKVLALFPEGMKPSTIKKVCLKIDGPSGDGKYHWAPSVYVPIRKGLRFGTKFIREDFPGIKKFVIEGSTVSIILAEDTTSLPPAVRDFVTKVASISEEHRAIDAKINAEVENMKNFLKDHKTLQSAIAAMPGLKFYINWFIQQELDAPEPEKPPRKPRKRAEKQPYDISGLVTKAAIARLNL